MIQLSIAHDIHDVRSAKVIINDGWGDQLIIASPFQLIIGAVWSSVIKSAYHVVLFAKSLNSPLTYLGPSPSGSIHHVDKAKLVRPFHHNHGVENLIPSTHVTFIIRKTQVNLVYCAQLLILKNPVIDQEATPGQTVSKIMVFVKL